MTLNLKTQPRLSVRIAGAVVLTVMPFLALGLVEAFLGFLHTKTASVYFETDKEALQRNDILLGKFILAPESFKEELKSAKTKIAIFGGSSATGFAAPIGFGKFLEKAAGDKLIVHNYAEPGAPFVGFQAEILKMVMKYYDVIIVYAGHNEIWSHVYAKSQDTDDVIMLPWGRRVNSKGAYLKHNLKLIELRSILDDDQPALAKIQNWLLGHAYRVSLESRVLHLMKIALFLASRASTGSESDATPLHYFSKNAFVDAEGKREILDNFTANVLEIRSRLKPTQRLIVSTVLANDLFPPLLDAFDARDDALDEAEKLAAALYGAAGKGEIERVSDGVSSLPPGAHRSYLEGVVCLKGIRPGVSDRGLDRKCLDLAQSARGRDAFPGRVLPEINTFIRTLAGTQTNVLVIDPESVLRSQEGQSAYLDFFVDFQHPSSLGHMLIASEILGALFPKEEIKLSKLDECERYSVVSAGKETSINVNAEQIKDASQTNMHWLEFFTNVKRLTSPSLYEYYHERAVEKTQKCLPQSSK